jgi:hypothetical protein
MNDLKKKSLAARIECESTRSELRHASSVCDDVGPGYVCYERLRRQGKRRADRERTGVQWTLNSASQHAVTACACDIWCPKAENYKIHMHSPIWDMVAHTLHTAQRQGRWTAQYVSRERRPLRLNPAGLQVMCNTLTSCRVGACGQWAHEHQIKSACIQLHSIEALGPHHTTQPHHIRSLGRMHTVHSGRSRWRGRHVCKR